MGKSVSLQTVLAPPGRPLQPRDKLSLPQTTMLGRALLGYEKSIKEPEEGIRSVIPTSRTSTNQFLELHRQVTLDVSDRKIPGVPRLRSDFVLSEGRGTTAEQLPNDAFSLLQALGLQEPYQGSDSLRLIERECRQALPTSQATQFFTEALVRLLNQLHTLCFSQELLDIYRHAWALAEAQNTAVLETIKTLVTAITTVTLCCRDDLLNTMDDRIPSKIRHTLRSAPLQQGDIKMFLEGALKEAVKDLERRKSERFGICRSHRWWFLDMPMYRHIRH